MINTLFLNLIFGSWLDHTAVIKSGRRKCLLCEVQMAKKPVFKRGSMQHVLGLINMLKYKYDKCFIIIIYTCTTFVIYICIICIFNGVLSYLRTHVQIKDKL